MKRINKRKKFFYIFEKVVSKLAQITFDFFKIILINAIDIPYQLFYKPFKKYVTNVTFNKFKKDLIEFIGGTLAFSFMIIFVLVLAHFN